MEECKRWLKAGHDDAGSMAHDGVREGYPMLLCTTLLLTSVLFSVFGVMGYGSYGDELCRCQYTGCIDEILNETLKMLGRI